MMNKPLLHFNQEILNATTSDNSFESLYEHFFTPLFKYVFFRLHDYDLAMDIVQTVFIKAFQHHESIDADKSLPYLYTIARNQIIDHYRKRKPVVLRNSDEFMASVVDDEIMHPEEYAKHNESFTSVHQMIESLPEFQRDIIILRYIQELNYAEIAIILDKKEPAIRQAVSRALRYLREYLPHLYEK